MKNTTVLIIDDSATIRALYCELLKDVSEIKVLDTAVDAQDARAKIKALNPDVVTLDIEMPGMDGLSFLEKIMTLRPMPVVMASTLTQKGADATIRALELGAVDYIAKPGAEQLGNVLETLKQELVSKILAASTANIHPYTKAPAKKPSLSYQSDNAPHIIAIGSSTGGVEALRDIFQQLPGNLPPIVIVQHMPEAFTASLAARLNRLSQVEVVEASQGVKLETGHAYLAPGGKHLQVVTRRKEWVCNIENSPPVSGHRPSVDVLFHSVAEAAGSDSVGIILTGMGRDGAEGMKRMRECGSYNIGQDTQSCVVYGMPKAANALGAVHKELPLSKIPEHLLSYLSQGRRKKHAV